MDIQPIETEADYDWAIQEVEQYFEHEPALDSEEAERFDVLSTLIEVYEAKHWPIKSLPPQNGRKHLPGADG
jgi:HTH-type transcriptional regulator/antitoxin HigA